jgi:hypothetical protein
MPSRVRVEGSGTPVTCVTTGGGKETPLSSEPPPGFIVGLGPVIWIPKLLPTAPARSLPAWKRKDSERTAGRFVVRSRVKLRELGAGEPGVKSCVYMEGPGEFLSVMIKVLLKSPV